jgi:hypothetical protein
MVDETALGAAIVAGIKDASGSAPSSSTPEPAATPDGGGNDDQGADDTSATADGGAEDTQDREAGTEAGGDDVSEGAAADDAAKGADSGADAAADAADGDAASAEADAAKGGKKADGADPVASDAKKEDEEGYDALLDTPLPNALKPATKERIRGLVTRVKETEAKADSAHRNFDELYTAIEQTGATPQQYAETLTILRLVNSNDRKSMETALQIKLAEIADLSKILGVSVPGVNLLEGFQDLIDDVGGGKLTLQRANEIAAARHSAQRAAQRSDNTARQSNDQRQRQQAINQGIQGLNDLGKRLAADPDFARKSAIVKAQLKPILKDIQPSRWVSTFETAYKELKLPPAAKPAARAPQNQPVRGGAPAGGQAKAPSTLEEAVRGGLKSVGT